MKRLSPEHHQSRHIVDVFEFMFSEFENWDTLIKIDAWLTKMDENKEVLSRLT